MLAYVTYGWFHSFHTNPLTWNEKEVPELKIWQYHINGFAIFCTWVLQMLIVGRIPRFGIYVEVFKKVSTTFLNFALAFLFLFVAFTLSFVALFQDQLAFNYASVVIKGRLFSKRLSKLLLTPSIYLFFL